MRNMSRRLDAVEGSGANGKPVVMACPWGADVAPMREMHLEAFPQDRGRLFVFVQTGAASLDAKLSDTG